MILLISHSKEAAFERFLEVSYMWHFDKVVGLLLSLAP
jgi:hypothetical protein